MKYFYSASTMRYGSGRWWHRCYHFPFFIRVTKTLTFTSKMGYPFAVAKFNKSIYNKVSLSNCGLFKWLDVCPNTIKENCIVSVAGIDNEVGFMVGLLDHYNVKGIELNFSCPNIKSFRNKQIPKSKHDIYLKLNYLMDPYKYDLDKIKGIRLNSIPMKFGGGSGLIAKEKNWKFIEKFGKELNVAGCSFNSFDDIKRLEDFGCKEIGIGSTILINPALIEALDVM